MTSNEHRFGNRDEFGRWLTGLREQAGLSVRDLAARSETRVGTLGGYLTGKHLPPAAQSAQFAKILDAVGVTDPVDQRAWLVALAELRRRTGQRSARSEAPYRGLLTYRADDADWFFGREALTQALVTRALGGGGPIAVVGPSGSGKSSVLQAGLVAAWSGPRVTIVPGAEPVETLNTAVDGLPDLGGLLVIDQFEELFTLVDAPVQRKRFIDRLFGLAEAGWTVVIGLRADFYGKAAEVPALLPILRDRQILVGGLSPAELREVIIGPAGRAGLTVAPELVDTLVVALGPVDSPLDAGYLPLLSHVLLATWQRGSGGTLGLDDYLAVGGLAGAVEQTADDVYDTLPEGHGAMVRGLLLRMVTLAEDGVATRRPAVVSDADVAVLEPLIEARLVTVDVGVAAIAHESLLSAWPRLREWVREDTAGLLLHRQLRSGAALWEESGRDESYLMTGGRLAIVDDFLADVDRSIDLEPITAKFVTASRAGRTATQRQRRRQLRRLIGAVTVTVVLALIATGLAIVGYHDRDNARTAAAMAAQARDRALSRQVAGSALRLSGTDPADAAQLALAAYRISPTVEARSALLNTSGASLPFVATGSPGTTVAALSGDRTRMALTDYGTGEVRLYSLADPSHPAVLGTAEPTKPRHPFSVTMSPDGRILVTGNSDGSLERWDISDPARPRSVAAATAYATGGVLAAVLSPDGTLLFTGGPSPNVTVWSMSTTMPERITELPIGPSSSDQVQGIAVSKDGRWLAAGGTSGSAKVYAVDGDRLTPMSTPAMPAGTTVLSAAFSPDGSRLAFGTKGGQTTVFEMADPTHPTKTTAQPEQFGTWINSLTFSPDGKWLAAANSISQARVWSVADGQQVAMVGLTGPATQVLFDASAAHLIAATTVGGFSDWPVPGPTLGPFGSTVFYTRFTADGSGLMVAPGVQTNRLMLWDITDRLAPRQQWAVSGPDDDRLNSTFALSPDKHVLAGALRGGNIQLWKVVDGRPAPAGELLDVHKAQQWATFDHSGSLLVSGGDDETVHLWDVRDPDHPRTVATVPELGGVVFGIAFSPDDRLMAFGTAQNLAYVYDVSDPAHPRRLGRLDGFTNYPYDAAFTPDGRTLAVASADHKVHLFDVTDKSHIVALDKPLIGPTDELQGIAITPDGTKVVAPSTDGYVWVWDITDRTHATVIAQLGSGAGAYQSVSVSPDGSVIAAGDYDGLVHTWLLDPTAVQSALCRQVGAPIGEDLWRIYLPDQPYNPPCS